MGRTTVSRRRRALTVRGRRRALLETLVASGAATLDTSFILDGSLASRRFYEAALADGYDELAADRWPSETAALGDVPGQLFRDGDEVVARLPDGTLVYVSLGHGWLHVRCAAVDRPAAAAACAAFRQAYPASYLTSTSDSRVPVTFWALGRYGPEPRLRRIESAAWSDVEGNYGAAVRSQLDELMGWQEPPGTGQLILWQGPPGTGKSWALRALASEWAPWAEFHYITDPDAFFVKEPAYMVNVLLSDSYEAIDVDSGAVVSETDPAGKWRVLILEDTGELLAANARETYAQGLSRLLNVVDGMIGQGLRVLALVTTNDQLDELHPAVARPGRCASQITFGPLTAEEASVWLGEPVQEGGTLAELYARRADGEEAIPTGEMDEITAAVPRSRTVTVGRSWQQEPDGAVRLDSVAADAAAALDAYWANHPAWYEHEKEASGVDPVVAPLDYWRVELLEPEHADVRALVEDGGVLTLEAAERWMAEADDEQDQDGPDDEQAYDAAYQELLRLAGSELPELEPSDEERYRPRVSRPEPAEVGRTVEALVASSPLSQLIRAHERVLEEAREIVALDHAGRVAARDGSLTAAAIDALRESAARPSPDIYVHLPPQQTDVHVEPARVEPQIVVQAAAAPPPADVKVDVHVPPIEVPAAQVEVHVPEPTVVASAPPEVHVHVPEQRRPSAVRVEYDDDGFKHFVPVEEVPSGDEAA